MNEEMETLLIEWMNRQDITWETSESDKDKLRGILERGMAYLRKCAGTPTLIFSDETKSLLFDYCRYDINNCREEFASAFAAELNMLRLSEGFNCGKDKKDAVL